MQKKEYMIQYAIQINQLYNNHNQHHYQLQRIIIPGGRQYKTEQGMLRTTTRRTETLKMETKTKTKLCVIKKKCEKRQKRRTKQHYNHQSYATPMITSLLRMETIHQNRQ